MGQGRANKGMGSERSNGHNTGQADEHFPDESDLPIAQRLGHNQRGRMAGEHTRTEGVVESFERMDPKNRA